jgi:hypothetical protein
MAAGGYNEASEHMAPGPMPRQKEMRCDNGRDKKDSQGMAKHAYD